MSTDDQTLQDAAAAVARALGSATVTQTHLAAATAAFSVVPEAILEEATLYTLRLDTVDHDEAHFAAAGGFRLSMHRGEWMERGRPVNIWITVQEALSAP